VSMSGSKKNLAEVQKMLKRVTPLWRHQQPNGQTGDPQYFSRLTPEMLERILAISPPYDYDKNHLMISDFHQTAIPVLETVKEMPGLLLHGFYRAPWTISVEGAYIPLEFAEEFKRRIEARAAHAYVADVYLPDEWNEEYVVHFERDGVLLETAEIEDWERYRAGYDNDGLPIYDEEQLSYSWTSRYRDDLAFWKKHGGKQFPQEPPQKVVRAWYD